VQAALSNLVIRTPAGKTLNLNMKWTGLIERGSANCKVLPYRNSVSSMPVVISTDKNRIPLLDTLIRVLMAMAKAKWTPKNITHNMAEFDPKWNVQVHYGLIECILLPTRFYFYLWDL